ncbi:MAG: DUF72 domain-containing protein [Thermoplasmataceae archaeon]
MEYRLGCSGWSYIQWVGPFYPSRTKANDFLKLYAKVFNTVEIDSTFYRIPSVSTLNNWRNSTPDDFLFCPKVFREITHESRLRGINNSLNSFLDRIRELGKKLAVVIFQLPPSLSHSEGSADLANLVESLPSDIQFAVEFRDNSWYIDETYRLLRHNNVILVWSEVTKVVNPGVSTSKVALLRLVGDRKIPEGDFGIVRKNRDAEIKKWTSKLNEERFSLDHVFAFANNHFQGFGPATIDLLGQSLGLKPLNWRHDVLLNGQKKQETLF